LDESALAGFASALFQQVHGVSNGINAAQLAGCTWEATRIDVGRLTTALRPGVNVDWSMVPG
jgi:hypothetical protein